ncbi:MAG: phage terminase large subunit [Acidobacteria bacterium]|nr:phage terminase large subunit [Acidobacteriota bacterium]
MFLSTAADIAIYGGAAGGGKSFGLLLEGTRHINVKDFGGVIFRRTSPMITNEGGLWDESNKVYPFLNAVQKETDHSWTFPAETTVSFAHLQHEKNKLDWQGSQICFLGFDELTHFTETQFFYMLSRNRSTCGVKPYVRATCNPDADSWVAEFISWWIDPETGYPIPDRAGKLRWFIRVNDAIRWADDPEGLEDEFQVIRNALPEDLRENARREDFIKSVTFIPSNVYDNKKLLEQNPQYLANLLALPLVERERLLGGNWKIKATAGKVFNREWFAIAEVLPKIDLVVSYWDFAATEKQIKTTSRKPDPDFTARVMIGYMKIEKKWFILDVLAVQQSPAAVEKLFNQTCKLDRDRAKVLSARFMVRWEIEPGSAAKRESYRMTTNLAGYDAKGKNFKGDKLTRARSLAVQAEAGNVAILKAVWNAEFLSHMHGQPDLPHDDIMDATAGAFNSTISEGSKGYGF